jgi:hypothetical protein
VKRHHVSAYGNGNIDLSIDGHSFVLDRQEAAQLRDDLNQLLDKIADEQGDHH